MDRFRRARLFVALASFAVLFLLVATPQLYLLLAHCRLFRADARTTRRAACRFDDSFRLGHDTLGFHRGIDRAFQRTDQGSRPDQSTDKCSRFLVESLEALAESRQAA